MLAHVLTLHTFGIAPSPRENEVNLTNRKGYHSLNLQVSQ